MTTQVTSIHKRAGKYSNTGTTYEQTTYGRNHLHLYLDYRNLELGRILSEYFPDSRPLRILEIGCGTGLVLEYLSSLPQRHQLCGVDASEVMLNQSRERFADRDDPPDFLLASCDDLSVSEESYDVVVATRFIHLFSHDEKKRIHTICQSLLRPGGVSIVEFYARPFHWLRYRLTSARRKTRDEFFSHYPTTSEVRDIVGGEFRRRPVRIAGSRVLYPLLRRSGTKFLTRHANLPGLDFLIDEYFVVTRKK